MGIAAAALLGVGGATFAQDASEGEPALVTMSASLAWGSLVPGGSGELAVRFEVADEWHIYWRNPGESGSATKITLTLPEGISAGETIWPAPERYIAGGDVLDYVHSGVVTFLIPITVAADARIGDAMRIGVHADWFVCNEDKCLIGAGDYEWPLMVLDPATLQCTVPGPDDLRSRMPLASPPSDLATSWRGGKLAMRVPGATALTFFEDSPSATMPRAINPLRDGESEGDRLTIEFAPETVAAGRVVTGVLSVKKNDGSKTHHEVHIPVPSTDNPSGANAAPGSK